MTWNASCANEANVHAQSCLWEHWGSDNLASLSSSDWEARFDLNPMIEMWAQEWGASSCFAVAYDRLLPIQTSRSRSILSLHCRAFHQRFILTPRWCGTSQRPSDVHGTSTVLTTRRCFQVERTLSATTGLLETSVPTHQGRNTTPTSATLPSGRLQSKFPTLPSTQQIMVRELLQSMSRSTEHRFRQSPHKQ